MKQPIKAALAGLAVILFASLSLQANPADDKKKKEDSTRKIEINGDSAKIRAALIKLEMDQGYILGDEQTSRVVFTEKKATGMRNILIGQAHFQDLFVFAAGSNPDSVTIYVTTEFCARMYRNQLEDCKVQNHKTWIQRLDKLLASLKTEVESTPLH